MDQIRIQGMIAATVESYFLVNGKLSYMLDSFVQGVNSEIYLAVENLTDEDYEYQAGYPMAGISAMAGVKVQF